MYICMKLECITTHAVFDMLYTNRFIVTCHWMVGAGH